tara:strand:- start:28 stop:1329 length:1302 start_codon:yes stop_codon:yes gene_type:complete
MKNKLINKIESKKVTIGVIGLGYVGLPLLLRYAEVGFRVVGFDIDKEKINKLNNQQSYISHISSLKIKKLKAKTIFTTDFSNIRDVDIVILCLPTPLNINREPNLDYIIYTFDLILPFLSKGKVISLESTTYPGTTEEILASRLMKFGFNIGKDIYLVYSPEREDPGNKKYVISNIPKIVSGHTNNCLYVGNCIYSKIVKKIISVSSTRTAEMTKLLENIHRAVNIGLVNEMKIVSDRMGIDIYEVIRAASSKPFGFVPYYPGPGLGGHCLPIDPFYLTWKAREYDLNTRFIELAGEVNTNMPSWVLNKTIEAINNSGLSIKGAKVLIIGIAYKKDIDDMRESPAVKLIKLLKEKKAKVEYSDPYIPIFPKIRQYSFDLKSVTLTPKKIRSYDALLIVTDHNKFNYKMIQRNAKLIIDTRGIYGSPFDNVIKA